MNTSSNVPNRPSGPAVCTTPKPASVPVTIVALPSVVVPVTGMWGKIGAGSGVSIKGLVTGVMFGLPIDAGCSKLMGSNLRKSDVPPLLEGPPDPGALGSCDSKDTACASCCSSPTREAVSAMRVTVPAESTTVIIPGSSTRMRCPALTPALITTSTMPCGRSLYVMRSSSKNANGLWACSSSMTAKVNAASVRIPVPRPCAALRILPTGVSMLKRTGLRDLAGNESEDSLARH